MIEALRHGIIAAEGPRPNPTTARYSARLAVRLGQLPQHIPQVRPGRRRALRPGARAARPSLPSFAGELFAPDAQAQPARGAVGSQALREELRLLDRDAGVTRAAAPRHRLHRRPLLQSAAAGGSSAPVAACGRPASSMESHSSMICAAGSQGSRRRSSSPADISTSMSPRISCRGRRCRSCGRTSTRWKSCSA